MTKKSKLAWRPSQHACLQCRHFWPTASTSVNKYDAAKVISSRVFRITAQSFKMILQIPSIRWRRRRFCSDAGNFTHFVFFVVNFCVNFGGARIRQRLLLRRDADVRRGGVGTRVRVGPRRKLGRPRRLWRRRRRRRVAAGGVHATVDSASSLPSPASVAVTTVVARDGVDVVVVDGQKFPSVGFHPGLLPEVLHRVHALRASRLQSPERASETAGRCHGRRWARARPARKLFFDKNEPGFWKQVFIGRLNLLRRLESSGQRRHVFRLHDGERQLPDDVVHVFVATRAFDVAVVDDVVARDSRCWFPVWSSGCSNVCVWNQANSGINC